MAKRIDVKDLDIYYGDFKAVEGVTMTRSTSAAPHARSMLNCGGMPGLRCDVKAKTGRDAMRPLNRLKFTESVVPTMIYQNYSEANQPAIDRTWGAALTLILIIFLLNLLGRFAGRIIARFGSVKK